MNGPPDDRPSPTVRRLSPRIEVDRDSVERGFASLVLTIVELLRQLMERQALRRVEVGDLSDDQIERIGATLMALEEQMTELREHFGLTPEDLNLDLGPLGPLLPRDQPPGETDRSEVRPGGEPQADPDDGEPEPYEIQPPQRRCDPDGAG